MRELDLPRAIVWEALVDPVLVSGWLHPRSRLLDGEQLEFREPESSATEAVLEVRSAEFGEVRIELVPLAGGTRGEATSLTLVVAGDWGRRADREALWSLRLDQLEELLRGHPVDWSGWAERHRTESEAARAEHGIRPAL